MNAPLFKGVITALINNQLTGAALAHCLNISGASPCIVDPETSGAFEEVKAGLETHVQPRTLGEARGQQRDPPQALHTRCAQLANPLRSPMSSFVHTRIARSDCCFWEGCGSSTHTRLRHGRAQRS